jgi:glutamyl-tRNA synthetase
LTTVRTRFAPSPTGFLHIGGARTALFNWLFARHSGGKFILRIEDTDAARSTDESVEAILDGLRWLGLDWDEGPFFQSRLVEEHKKEAARLLEDGLLYRCWCTPDELKLRREAALKAGKPPKYDGKCRKRTDAPDGPHALRFKVEPGTTVFKDLIKGDISIDNSTIEDLVILRSDSTPTYNFTVVVDDAAMGITHVLRGDDHINNTAKQILLYRALGFDIPVFAHLPMILGADKARLSKRHGATSVTAYREMGILPQALINYLARLGWSHGDQEIFTIDELKEKFTMEHVGKSSGVFNPEKLLWLNQHYIKEEDPERIAELLVPILKSLAVETVVDERLVKIVKTLAERAKTLVEMAAGAVFFFTEEVEYDEKASKKFLTPESALLFRALGEKLSVLADFTEASIESVFGELMKEKGIKLGALAQPVRVALTGGTKSPGIFETIAAMGPEMTKQRLDAAIQSVKGIS